jgi:hypothetical protein
LRSAGVVLPDFFAAAAEVIATAGRSVAIVATKMNSFVDRVTHGR